MRCNRRRGSAHHDLSFTARGGSGDTCGAMHVFDTESGGDWMNVEHLEAIEGPSSALRVRDEVRPGFHPSAPYSMRIPSLS